MTIEVGKKAPAFKAKNQRGESVGLADLKDRWNVLYFYPKDDTPGCTTQACEFTSSIKDFERLNATVLGMSPDNAASHQSFIAKHDLKIDLLSDPDHDTMEAYEAWGEKTLYGRKSIGVKRSTVIIDPDGKIAAHWKSVKSKGHALKVAEKLAELQDGR